MIHHKCAPLSREWLMLRCGLPTSSEFHRIVTPGGKLSEQSRNYMHCLLAELMLATPLENPATQWMVRGQETEAEAISAYEFQTEVETDQGGFFTNDAKQYGASPDRLVGSSGILEMKVPAPNTHIGYLLEEKKSVAKDHFVQVQGQLFVTEREWVDIVSYHEMLPLVVMRIERDEKYIGILADSLNAFVDQMAAKRAQLEAKFGPFPQIEVEPAIEGIGALGITNEDLEAILADHQEQF